MPTLEEIKNLEIQRKKMDSFSPIKGLSEKEIQDLYNDFASKYGDANAPQEVSAFHGSWELVGQHDATNKYCGTFQHYNVCKRVDLHNQLDLNGVSHKGEVFVRKVYASCDSPKCRVCLHDGYARREADHIAQRVKRASLGWRDDRGKLHAPLGTAYHIVVSPPKSDWDLAEFHNEEFRAKVKKILIEVGCVGGGQCFHGFAYADYGESLRKGVMQGWYWRPHVHNIAWIRDGYGACRSCQKYVRRYRTGGGKLIEQHGSEIVCKDCGGFENKVRLVGAKYGGYIIKNLDERTSIFATAWYCLQHSTIRRDS